MGAGLMDSSIIRDFANSRNKSVIAPAGCGKTHLIASAVVDHNTGKELILTHTNAGVSALRDRLSKLGGSPTKYRVSTIAGWALRYTKSFQAIAGLKNVDLVTIEWDKVYNCALNMLDDEVVRKVISLSYTGLYVDEYQDCLEAQHEIVKKLSTILPCRIVGDPLQSIFGFRSNKLASWSNVIQSFPTIKELDTPWRWSSGDVDLGNWLLEVRKSIDKRENIDLKDAPSAVKWLDAGKHDEFRKHIYELASIKGESTCIIRSNKNQCHGLARNTGACYFSMETIECEELVTWASKFEGKSGLYRAESVYKFAYECMTKVRSKLKHIALLIEKQKTTTKAEILHVVESLSLVANEDSLLAVSESLERIKNLEGAKIFRKELFEDMMRSLKIFNAGESASLREAALIVRERTRQNGRNIGNRVVSRTLLIKGLEFDHCIVHDIDKMNKENLYVALTRGSKTLTIVSNSPVLCVSNK